MTFEELEERWSLLWLPRERLPLSEWAEKHFYLSPEYSNRTGPVRLFGWQRGIFDAFTDERVNRITVMCGVQLVKTLLIQAALAYSICEAPGPMLLVQPKDSAAKKFSKKRLGPMLRDCPELRGKVRHQKRDQGNTIEYKAFPGGDVTLVGAISPDNLARESIRYLFLDEVDKYPLSAGNEGDPIDLAIERTITFGSRAKIILACSPTVRGRSRILKSYEESDQRKLLVPCHRCGYQQILVWAQVRYSDGPVRYECEECHAGWSDVERWNNVDRGTWQAHAPFNGHVGCWISHLYSPFKKLDAIVKQHLAVKDDPPRFQAWVNTTLAEPWEDRGEAPDYEKLMARREPTYRLGQVPDGVLFLTAGVDVQKTWLDGYVWGWGRGQQRWLIDHWRIERNPYDRAAWDLLTTKLNASYPHASGAEMNIMRMGVDTGYATQEVYRWAREQGSRVLATDGRNTSHDRTIVASLPTLVDVTVSGRKFRRGAKLWPINVWTAKEQFYGLLTNLERPEEGKPYPPNWVHFPSDAQEEFFRQLTAESLVTRAVKGGYQKKEWIKTRERNEALDCAIIAWACALHMRIDKFDERRWQEFETTLRYSDSIEPEPKPTEPIQVAQSQPQTGASPHQKPSWFGDRGRDWFAR